MILRKTQDGAFVCVDYGLMVSKTLLYLNGLKTSASRYLLELYARSPVVIALCKHTLHVESISRSTFC